MGQKTFKGLLSRSYNRPLEENEKGYEGLLLGEYYGQHEARWLISRIILSCHLSVYSGRHCIFSEV